MNDTVLHRTFTASLENTDGRLIEGCCVPYGEAARVRDYDDGPTYFEAFEPGAFRRQLKASDKLELRYEHRDDLAHSIGVCRHLYEEASGLYGTFAVHAGAFGDQALELVRSGILPGFSVGFRDRFTHWKRTAEGTVLRSNCHLDEVSLCRSPAFAGAAVTAVRSRREWEEALELPTVADAQLERLRAIGVSV